MDEEEDVEPEVPGASLVAPPCASWTLRECARALDEAAGERTRYSMALAVRERFGIPLLATIATAVAGNDAATAALLTFEYHLNISAKPPRRVTLDPRDEVLGRDVPPRIKDLPEQVVQLWRELLGFSASAVMTARLNHLLFVRGGSDARTHALAASDAYAEAAATWDRGHDAVEDLSASLRLARAVGSQTKAAEAMDRLLDMAEHEMGGADPKFGIALSAIEAVLDERDCPARVDDLLVRAQESWTDSYRYDQILAMQLVRAATPADRAEVWQRRVQAKLDAAAAADSAIMKSLRFREALVLADLSESRSLRRIAAAGLASVRGVLDEMVHLRVSSQRYAEEVERVVDSMAAGDNWSSSLVRFASVPALSGATQTNRQLVRDRFAASPLSALMPAELFSPEGLPYLSGGTESDRFDIELARLEEENIGHMIRPLARALNAVLHDQPPPPASVLVGFIDTWPGVHSTARRLADILLRYWTGDADAAAYLAFPVIERMVRELVEASGSGTYRLQRHESPGQFPPLGTLLPLLAEEYALDESRARYLQTVLVHPGGANLRNLMAHGYLGQIPAPWAAVLVHCALVVATLELPESSDDGEGDAPS